MRAYFLSVLFTLYIRLVGWTTRITYIGEENLPGKPYLYAFWHRYILFVSYTHRGRAVRVLASTSKDGDVSARTNSRFGHRILRGTASSSREGARTALKIISCLKQGNVVAVTPDGPKGPRFVAKKGTCYLAQKAGCPIVPIAWSSKRKKILNTWDRTILPLPFSRAVIMTGKPVYVGPAEDIESSSRNLEAVLNKLGTVVEKLVSEL
ncbi:MAG: lysophospholipid acyltransferase family protein [Elusimicrobiota bacterium]